MSREISRSIGLGMVAGGLLLASTSLVETFRIDPSNLAFEFQTLSGNGIRYTKRTGLQKLKRISCEAIPIDPERAVGMRFRGSGTALVAIGLNNGSFSILDSRGCKYPIV